MDTLPTGMSSFINYSDNKSMPKRSKVLVVGQDEKSNGVQK